MLFWFTSTWGCVEDVHFICGSFYPLKSVCFFLFSVKSVQQQDAGKYWCEVEYHGRIISSEPAWITVEGMSAAASESIK